MSSDIWDVIVIGAGPAGAATALRLARAGRRAALIDASHFPRQKVCGEFLSAAAWRMLDELDLRNVRRFACGLRKLRLIAPSGRCVESDFGGEREPAAVSRFELDRLLVDAATAAGAMPFFGRRLRNAHLAPDGRSVTVALVDVHDVRNVVELTGRAVIAADGRRSQVVRDTGVCRSSGAGLVGFKRHLRLVDPTAYGGTIEMHALSGGYLGVCPVAQGVVNLCGMLPKERLQATRGDVAGALRAWVSDRSPLRRLLAQADDADRAGRKSSGALDETPAKWHTMPEVALQRSRPSVAGVLYVGDAMGTIEPLTGQGMTMALAGAKLAAESILTAPHGAIDRRLQQSYEQAWQAAFGPTIRTATWLGRLLRRPSVLEGMMIAAGPWPRIARRLFSAAHDRTLTLRT